ncbi:sigma-70 family RNA polymerase sigma factor [Devosia chinhatensis]|uniref:RNA polymerase sigma factor n=1 Tax=Devosia chinhatensis TaxID=429727 RepID=A0A0F5FME5_9HYPH|nr:sigma-70 family RNA polymerase sigma factor [Devosia chinhatensis]KKB09998.1 RNA polymerase sigma factor [Devosia chinhatensis]
MTVLETPEALILDIARGNRHALARLFEAEAGRLLAIAQRLLRRRDLAEEAVQETFLSVWRTATGFDPQRGTARGWLTVMVRNRALNMLRDGARIDYEDGEKLAELGDRASDARDAFEALSIKDAIRHCLSSLDAPKREAILLCYVTGLNHGEAAATMNVPLGTVKSWVRRGVSALQECLS